jgi:hypothetical protein
MSSATSTSGEAVEVGLKPDATERSSVRLQPDHSFRHGHFFVLASLMAATAAVVMSRQSTPEHLILISLTIAAAGLAAAGFYRMLSPLVGDASAPVAEALSERARAVLMREKGLVLRALKDLEFDRSMGKVSQADFDEMASRLRARALSLMQQLDLDATGYKTIIEKELAARLAGRAAGAVRPEAAVAHVEVHDAPGTCACGTVNDADARFCKQCGAKLSAAVITP